LIPKKFTSRIDFMSEILKKFSIEIAKQKNNSFQYFVEKYMIAKLMETYGDIGNVA